MPPKRPYGCPPGLRGRNIGLYYKSLQMKKGKTEERQQPLINLKIPRNVTSAIENNIKFLKKLASDLQIPLKPMNSLSIIDNFNEDKESTGVEPNTAAQSSSSTKPPQSYDMTQKSKEKSSKTQYEEEEYAAGPSTCSDCTRRFALVSNKLSLQGAKAFKYGYEDIIKGTFVEKLDECLARGNSCLKYDEDLSLALHADYEYMMSRDSYEKLLEFRKMLPAYKKSKELLQVIKNNQVVVISGETGCGKSTQVPQIILDDALANKIGSNVKILVTQPRRIAASSLAKRVAEERGERMGNSVGYAVRLEKVDPRTHGSILFCTTGILLTELEVDQGLGNFSHIILDEVHERDTHIDLALCMLKKVIDKRKDLKLILMSATIDAEKLSEYFNNCPMTHIEGLAYPVKDIYLEEILQMVNYQLPCQDRRIPNLSRPWQRHTRKHKDAIANTIENDVKYRAEISSWLESKKSQLRRDVYFTLQDARIEELNVDLIFELIKVICKGDPGAILVFLPGIGDITKLLKMMNDTEEFRRSSAYAIYPLHSKLPSLEQHKIFERPPGNVRKIIVATNIAETSITIDDIVYVIDCGKIKYSGLNVEENVATLKAEWISQANLRQRRGRAGRCQPGICYHLVTSFRAERLDEHLKPEIQRTSLLEAVLSVKRLRLGKADEALNSMPAPPALATVENAVKHLQKCGALDSEETLTPLGWHLARLPVHPAAGKLLLLGALFGCLDRAASVAAVWGFKDPFLLVIGKEKQVDEARRAFAQGVPSDHVAISEAIINWELCSKTGRRNFAYEHYLSNNTIEMLSEMKKQLGENLKQMGFLPSGNVKSAWENRNSDNFSLFKAVVAAALYPNIATVKWTNLNARNKNKLIRLKVRTPEDGNISLHPSSIMAVNPNRGGEILCVKPGANWLVYWLKQRSSDLYLIDVTLVYTLPLLFFGELNVSRDQSSDDCLISISSIKVRCRRDATQLLYEMRSLLDQVLAAKITAKNTSATKHNKFEEKVLDAVIQLITAEDESAEYMGDSDKSDSDQSEYESNRSWYK